MLNLCIKILTSSNFYVDSTKVHQKSLNSVLPHYIQGKKKESVFYYAKLTSYCAQFIYI